MTTNITAEEMALQREFAKKCAEMNAKRENPPTAHVHTFGCQQNVSDGEKIKGMLAAMGCGFSDTPEGADIIIFNTCAVRENAEDRVFGNLGALKHEKRRNPDVIIGVCGCMVQQEHIVKRIKRSFPHVDLVFGTNALHTLPELVYGQLTEKKREFCIPEGDGVIAEGIPLRRESALKASIPIMYGCNNFCTYCIVPYVRGRERSRKPEDVLAEARSAIAGGARELLLLGQNVNSYGKELGTSFPELLRAVNALDGEFRICYMSSHPKDATRELIDAIAECEKVTRHFHLPVQSGSSRILGLMNRRYTREDYLKIAKYIREKIPDAALTSDIIVGFPGETREDFEETLSLIREVRFDSLYTFIYSPRKGTKAAEMPDPISAEEKGGWFRELLDVQSEIGRDMYGKYVGKTLRVLCEGEGRTDPNLLTGKTPQDVIVDFDGDKSLIGGFVDVKIERAYQWALVGKIV
ncbi:MAG: tRNA (N6-isopentenyl adenosine(37)-C2)-methylthiotransferase MiaB [Lachnospiraceae bacterium]|nr:tRNA (N6-isopentenyl adenosine(37)-C2)-methylthiotransferase MiaB [Ruminococcus sp.]MCM1274713.1 tRNA (N6-isopentenyl adenosine(37)-C2)-methylthiotransferase MiaB [Lachnospiraceae bacterium]